MKNPLGAGRKPNWFETKNMRVPVDLIPELAAKIAEYKIKGEDDAKRKYSDASKASD